MVFRTGLRIPLIAAAVLFTAAAALAQGQGAPAQATLPPTGLPAGMAVQPVPEKGLQVSALVRIAKPTLEGAVVDNCETWGTNCGGGGAQAYCRSVGHARAVTWATYLAGRTWVMGSKRHCDGVDCVGYSVVICEK